MIDSVGLIIFKTVYLLLSDAVLGVNFSFRNEGIAF